MSVQEDFGSLLEVLVACVAAIDLFQMIGLTTRILEHVCIWREFGCWRDRYH